MFSGSNEEISSDASSSSSSVSGDSGVQSLSLSSFPVSEAPGLAQAIKKIMAAISRLIISHYLYLKHSVCIF